MPALLFKASVFSYIWLQVGLLLTDEIVMSYLPFQSQYDITLIFRTIYFNKNFS
jgi:hypothetical protein